MQCGNGLPRVSVEPLLFSSMMFITMYTMISQQYIYKRFSFDNGLINATGKYSQCFLNSTDPRAQLEKKVSAETSLWVLYLNVAGVVPSVISATLIGSWGDTVGRRKPMISVYLGAVVMISIYISVFHFRLPLYVLLIGRLVCGLSGDFTALLASCFAYVADISSTQSRTIRFAVAEASIGIGGVVGSFVTGAWVKQQGLELPLWLPFALTIFGFVYTLFLLPESIQRDDVSFFQDLKKLFTCNPFVGLWRMLTLEAKRGKQLLSVLFCFFLVLVLYNGYSDVIVVYELSPPFCWTSDQIGYGSMITAGSFIVALVAFKLLNNRCSDWWFVFIGVVSMTTSFLILAFAKQSWNIYLACSIGILCTMPVTAIRSMLSRLVNPEEQGSIFALVACAQTISQFSASVMYNTIYKETVAFFPGTVFLVAVGISVFILIIFSFVYKYTKDRLQLKIPEYSQVEENC
uniref:proton-coupled folate transporter-like n=1 Tax=Ciona intestinalis TaxID=7719 RepID=UPI00089DCFDC|nr:proton-coupled folate transporter-like [Ciona intestinalis]|eukprot:XP_018671691.1 proton-coupled folate transporter-like [Ciona intestinalis]